MDSETCSRERAKSACASACLVGAFKKTKQGAVVYDADVCIGRDIEEAIDYQLLVGPSGEIIREAGELGQQKLPDVRRDLHELMAPYLRDDGVWMPSSTWAIMARRV